MKSSLYRSLPTIHASLVAVERRRPSCGMCPLLKSFGAMELPVEVTMVESSALHSVETATASWYPAALTAPSDFGTPNPLPPSRSWF